MSLVSHSVVSLKWAWISLYFSGCAFGIFMLFVVVLVVVTLVVGLIDCSEDIILGGVCDESVSKFAVCKQMSCYCSLISAHCFCPLFHSQFQSVVDSNLFFQFRLLILMYMYGINEMVENHCSLTQIDAEITVVCVGVSPETESQGWLQKVSFAISFTFYVEIGIPQTHQCSHVPKPNPMHGFETLVD